MTGVILTTYQGKILGPIAKYILGPIMNGIFVILDKVFGNFDSGLIGLSIIIFTIVVYLLLMPLTIKQQKFSKFSAIINPELQAIQAKYKGRQDSDSMMAMNAETKALYAKYGVSQTGSCLQTLITLPIFFALYRVIYSLPAYIPTIKKYFEVIANRVISSNLVEEIKGLKAAAPYLKNFDIAGNQTNAVIDVLNSMNVDELAHYAGSSTDCLDALEKIRTYNYFLGMNLSNSPSYIVSQAWNNAGGKQWGLIIAAILIPVLAGVTQWLNVKLMPQQNTNTQNNKSNQSDTAQSMQQSMNMMNNIMPIMSIVFCFSFSSGVGIYWIAGSVIRSIQQVIINKKIDKIDIEEVIKKNAEKSKKKLEKAGKNAELMSKYSNMNTRNIGTGDAPQKRRTMSDKASVTPLSQKEKDEAMKEAAEYYAKSNKDYKPGSIAAKANMVRSYNESNKNN